MDVIIIKTSGKNNLPDEKISSSFRPSPIKRQKSIPSRKSSIESFESVKKQMMSDTNY